MLNKYSCEYCNTEIKIEDKTVLSCPKCLNPCWPAEVKALARANKIAAIKVYRFVTNVGLKEAKDAVDGISSKGFLALPASFSMPAQTTPTLPPTGSGYQPKTLSALEQEIMAYIVRGALIEAIKLYREKTGVGLKEAKDAVEALRDGNPVKLPEPSPRAAEEDTRAKILALVQQGQYIEAIKLYREKSGVGLKEAKDVIDAVRAGQPLSLNLLSDSENAAADGSPTAKLALVEAEILAAIKEGNKIVAIKLYKGQTGLGLKESKDAVEGYMSGARRSLFDAAPPKDENEALRAELLSLLKDEGLINAIRRYREVSGASLKDGKDFIEALELDPKISFPKI